MCTLIARVKEVYKHGSSSSSSSSTRQKHRQKQDTTRSSRSTTILPGLDRRGFGLRLAEVLSLLQTILDEADAWDGLDVSEVAAWEARVGEACTAFQQHVAESF